MRPQYTGFAVSVVTIVQVTVYVYSIHTFSQCGSYSIVPIWFLGVIDLLFNTYFFRESVKFQYTWVSLVQGLLTVI